MFYFSKTFVNAVRKGVTKANGKGVSAPPFHVLFYHDT